MLVIDKTSVFRCHWLIAIPVPGEGRVVITGTHLQ